MATNATWQGRVGSDTRIWLQKPLVLTEVDVHWIPQNRMALGYNIRRSLVFRSLPEMTLLNAVPVTIPFYRDQTIEMRNLTEYWYAVTEVMGDGTENSLGDPVSMQSFFTHSARRHETISIPRILQEYVRRKLLILDNDAERVMILIRKTAGPKCGCYSETYEQGRVCPRCFGIGYEGGYEILRDILLRILPLNQNVKLSSWGLAVQSAPPAWLADWPLLRNGDVVIRADGLRWTIRDLALIITQGILTEQTMQLDLVDPSHPVYTVPVQGVIEALPEAVTPPFGEP